MRPPSAVSAAAFSAAAVFILPALLLPAFCASGCSRSEGATSLAPAASSLSSSTAEPDATTWHYIVDSKSRAHVDLPGLKERIQGDTSGAGGSLDVDGTDLSKSRGTIRIDLATFATNTFGNDDDATQTKHARTWLEVTVGDRTNEKMRWADFAIRSIDGVEQADLSKVAPVREGANDVRKVSLTVHGDLLVHGHAVPKDDRVDVGFRYPAGAAAGSRPTQITIDSKQPLRVVLKEHDVRPRDPAGQLLDWTAKLVSKVAETADVTVHLTATPAP